MSWQRTLWILWMANFSTATGISMILPFLPLYLGELGVTDESEVLLWSGFIFSAQALTSIFFQPIWGSFADRYGHKLMLMRAGIFGSIITMLMGFAGGPWHLLLLRMANGAASGFIPMAVSMQAAVTPDQHTGKALGTLQTGVTAGMLIGPLIGGVLAGFFGFRTVFILTGLLSLVSTLIVGIYVKNNKPKQREVKETPAQGWSVMLPLLPIFAATMLTQLAMMSIQPIIPIYAASLTDGSHTELIAGLVISVAGIGTLIGSPILGRMGDAIGQRAVLIFSLIMCGMTFIPQALTSSIIVLLASRFCLGLFIGGMLPSLNTLIKKLAPQHMQSRAQGLNASSQFIGNLTGPIMGSVISASFGFRSIFFITMGLLFANAIIIWMNQKLKQQIKEHEAQQGPVI
ncbi:MFS transporter [Paenibacillus sp. FSL W8-0186]|uniref:MFS transporter n=1 Tax=Paenibacillus TaxID=44249 RepID=UPI0030CAE596